MKLRFTLAILLSAVLTGCGGDDNTGEQASLPIDDAEVLEACDAYCDTLGDGINCTSDEAFDCHAYCEYYEPGFTEDCKRKALALYECGATAEWLCPTDDTGPYMLDEMCAAEVADMEGCYL